jgi:hypothetical protein
VGATQIPQLIAEMIGVIGELFARERWAMLLDRKAAALITALGLRVQI